MLKDSESEMLDRDTSTGTEDGRRVYGNLVSGKEGTPSAKPKKRVRQCWQHIHKRLSQLQHVLNVEALNACVNELARLAMCARVCVCVCVWTRAAFDTT